MPKVGLLQGKNPPNSAATGKTGIPQGATIVKLVSAGANQGIIHDLTNDNT